MRIAFVILFVAVTAWARAYGQCYQLAGKIVDASTDKATKAKVFLRTAGRKQPVGETNVKGEFSIGIPCESTGLVIEQPGFRTLTLPLSGQPGTYAVALKLHPVDKQATDRPYFQSEQQDLVLNNSDSTEASRFVTRYFKLVDINTGKPVKGEICLFFTQKDTKQCLPITNGTKQTEGKMLFTQKDIIGIVATADGYQTYHGNLIIEQLDRSTSIYEIALSKPMSIISFMVEAGGNSMLQITDARGGKVAITMADAAHGYAEVQPAQAYQLGLAVPGAVEKAIATQILSTDGLLFTSLKSVVSRPVTSAPQPTAPAQALVPDTAITKPWMIYFDQSRYELRPSAKQTLDSLASLLKNSSGYRIEITGHTDNVGDAQRNLALSEFRSRVTSHYLVEKGIAPHAVHWQAKGGKLPAYSNDQDSTKAMNRRVELKVILE